MTLHAIVAALGGDLYQNGCRANVPAPGHSAADRSVSLLLANGRIIVHGFGEADWRTVRDHLFARGLMNWEGRPVCGRPGASPARPDPHTRTAVAASLWDGTVAVGRATPAALYLGRRAVSCAGSASNLRHHPGAPVSVYRPGGRRRPGLIARISDDADRLTAIELSYLEPNGSPALGLRLARKTVGQVPRGAAVRLAPAAPRMLVGEGVVTTLSAMDRFILPGWALMAAHNLAAWTPPAGVSEVLIAADRGPVGEGAAERLLHRLVARGLSAEILCPQAPFGDWNEAAMGQAS